MRTFLISQLLSWVLKLMRPGDSGRLEIASGSVKFYDAMIREIKEKLGAP